MRSSLYLLAQRLVETSPKNYNLSLVNLVSEINQCRVREQNTIDFGVGNTTAG